MTSMTPDCRKVGTGMEPSPLPFYTLRIEKRRPDSRGSDWNFSRQDNDKEVNVQVLLRCRPLTDEEQRLNVPKVLTYNENRREVAILQNVASKQLDKTFTFDKVFGPKAQQRAIYDQAIAPIVSQVLEGFNCTVFAYGQTGTGKTYTMEGGMRNKVGELPAEAGVIPRSVRQIFDTLEAQNADYSMKVTFLELYNEEVTDLLAQDDQVKSTEERMKKPISLMEDGKGSVLVRGLEEEVVYSANEIYTLLERGASRRRTADTLLNKRSSRSHSIFTITVHIKEGSIGDEEFIKCGKLNLVDLAGSENISRSGAREVRAREAGEINKSLLTLGRVINALVEHSIHVPYRDSKLTRLLRDSLGGKTKTCIIATVSPSAFCLEETMSTLDYAYRAKSIKNKPEVNQKVSKAVLLKDLYVEIERMKQDIRAAREKNGVYIPHERFAQDEAEKKAKTEKIEQLEVDLSISEKELDKCRGLYHREQEDKLNVESELQDCKKNLELTCKRLHVLENNYKAALLVLKEKESIISKLQHSESNLIDCAKKMRVDLQDASEDISSLFGKIDRKDKLERENQGILLSFGTQLDNSLKDLNKSILSSVSEQEHELRFLENCMITYLARKTDSNKAMESKMKHLTETYTSGISDMKKITDILHTKASSNLEEMKSMISVQATSVENFLETAFSEAKEVICTIQNSLNEQRQLLAFSAQQQAEGLNRNLVLAQGISNATINFSNDLHQRASELVELLEQSQIEKCDQLQNFEKKFKEEACREEKIAMEKIAAILTSLTARKTSMVSKASKSFENSSTEESKKLLLGLSNMQQVLVTERNEINEYLENIKDHHVKEAFSSMECRETIENCMKECSENVELSSQQWQNTRVGITLQAKNGLHNIESTVQEKDLEAHSMHKTFVSSSSTLTDELNKQINHFSMSINDSLMLDEENEKDIASITGNIIDKLKSVAEHHSERVSYMCTESEKCIHKDFLVDKNTSSTPMKRKIQVASVESIMEMRTLVNVTDSKSKSKSKSTEKILQNQERTPFRISMGVI